MDRTQFTFYESFYKALVRIRKDADRAKAYDAITRFALYGEGPDLDTLPDAVAIAFEVIRPNLEASRRKAAGGTKGKSQKDIGKIPQRYPEQEKEKEQEKGQVKEKEQMLHAPARVVSPRFTPPTVEEVRGYIREKGYSVDPEAFVAFYASKGWKVGSAPMKDWRAAVVTWSKRGRRDQPTDGNPFLEIVREEEARQHGQT